MNMVGPARLEPIRFANAFINNASSLHGLGWGFLKVILKFLMVGPARLELARPYGQQILSLQRLPFRHGPILNFMTLLFRRSCMFYTFRSLCLVKNASV